MTRTLSLLLCVCLVATSIHAAPAADANTAVTDAEVDAAVQRMRDWLYAQQDPATGSFDNPGWGELKSQSYHATGETALITYALLLSGASHQDPRIAKAIEFLRSNRADSTYIASLRAHIWARLPEDQTEMLEKEADYLRSAMRGGKFYYQADSTTWSNSLTQYGALGMWEYAKRGGEVKDDFWESVGEHIFTDQNKDGGWGYNDRNGRGGGKSTGSMTAAGVAILQLAQQRLAREVEEPNARLTEAIQRGLEWLDQRFDPTENPGLKKNYRFYYLYGIERLALAGGLSTLNGQDWFAAGSRFILDEEKDKGFVSGRGSEMSSRINTAFALSFLARGRVPVWVSKLKLPSQTWNNRPNDLYFLNSYLSDEREAELNWQIVSIDDNPDDWARTPLLYLSGNDRVQLTPEQQAKLKRYLDLGGTLMINAEGRRSVAFRRTMESIVEEMYPDYKFAVPKDDHPFLGLITKIRGNPRLRTVHNGVRDLVIAPAGDWSYDFQAGSPGKAAGWETMINVYASITDRGEMGNRLIPVLPTRDPGRESTGTIEIVRASHQGNWDAEPLALEIAGIDVFNRSGKSLDIAVQPLATLDALVGSPGEASTENQNAEAEAPADETTTDETEPPPAADAGDASETADAAGVTEEGAEADAAESADAQPSAFSGPALVHLTDPGETKLTEDELAGLQRFVEAGGTVLVETVGGLTGFADDAGTQIAEALGGERRWLDASHPIISGDGLDGGVDAKRVTYRSYTQTQGSPGDGPSLAAIYIDGRPAVVLSPRDLSLGALGSRHYRINGYTPASARALLGNLILWAAQQTSP